MPPSSSSSSWEQTCAKVKAHRDSTIASIYPPLPPIPTGLPLNVTSIPALVLTHTEFAITSTLPTTTLLNHLSTRAISSTAVVSAYLRRAALAQELTNCLTELLPSRALVRALWLDDYIAVHGKTIGPLHGLPISVKEHISMEGLECNAGFVSWVGRQSVEDALVPVTGMAHAMAGCEQLLGTLGPLSTSICGIKLFMRTVIDAELWLIEPSLIPLPWREYDLIGSRGGIKSSQSMDEKAIRKLKIAVVWDDGVVRPHAPVRRVLREVVENMRKCTEIEVVDWKPHRCKDAWEILVSHCSYLFVLIRPIQNFIS